jgi:tetratricopeptide (TPR) repeat protein
VIHHFPLFTADHSLSRQDFRNFFLPFSKVIKKKIATATDVYFLEDTWQLDDLPIDISQRSLLKEFFLKTSQTLTPAAHKNCLFFPFPVRDEQIVVAMITGIDSLLVKKVGHDWLQEIRDTLLQEFLILKQAGIDPQTGLLNCAHLNTLLNTLPDGEHVGLTLVEIYPQARTAMEAMRHARRATTALKSFIGERAPLHHIGQSVFAFFCRNCNEDSAARLGPLLVSFLKHEQFKRVHIGYSQGEISHDRQNNSRQIFDEAWLALQTSCKRGPFSFCTHRSLQNSQRHSLYASDRALLARLQPHWMQLDKFTLIQLHPAKATDNIYDKIILNAVDSKKFTGQDNDIYILLSITDTRKVLSLVRKILQSLPRDKKNKNTVSAGIAIFPFYDFKKSEMVLNCRKALLHGDLLGEGMLTIFDALSLNVSGDIFYGEGDLPRAVKEYKRGLSIQPQDVNLLNSLGVCFAMMNRRRLANDCFLKTLAVKNDDFISWYNLGLGREAQGNISGAVTAFEHACKCHIDVEYDNANVRDELPFQLGKSYCQTERYQETLDNLLPWYNTKKSDPGSGRALRYLGESFHGVGRIREAMSWLQRAIRFDEFDADALSLLGEIYLDNNEGDQIALKLCEKSIELNPIPALFHLRLARAQIRCGHLDVARETLRRCLKDKETKGAAWLQMGLISWKQGQKTRAQHWFSKILTHAETDTNGYKQASSYIEEIQTK